MHRWDFMFASEGFICAGPQVFQVWICPPPPVGLLLAVVGRGWGVEAAGDFLSPPTDLQRWTSQQRDPFLCTCLCSWSTYLASDKICHLTHFPCAVSLLTRSKYAAEEKLAWAGLCYPARVVGWHLYVEDPSHSPLLPPVFPRQDSFTLPQSPKWQKEMLISL